MRNEIIQIIDSKGLTIEIYGNVVNEEFKKSLIADLRSIKCVTTNHSGPTEDINVNLITNNKMIHLLFYRDSKDSTLYWIYVNDYKTSTKNDVGKVKTTLLDKY